MAFLLQRLKFLFPILLISCSPKPERIAVETLIGDSIVNLCKISNWDSIMLVRPYMRNEQWKKYNIKNLDSIEKELSTMESIDWKNYFVFIVSNKATAYAEVPMEKFNVITNQSFSNNPFIKKDNCTFNIVDGAIMVSNTR